MKKRNGLLALASLCLLVSCGNVEEKDPTTSIDPTTNESTRTEDPTTETEYEPTVESTIESLKAYSAGVLNYEATTKTYQVNTNDMTLDLQKDTMKVNYHSNEILRSVKTSENFTNATLTSDGTPSENDASSNMILETYIKGERFYSVKKTGETGEHFSIKTDEIYNTENIKLSPSIILMNIYESFKKGKQFFVDILDYGQVEEYKTTLTKQDGGSYYLESSAIVNNSEQFTLKHILYANLNSDKKSFDSFGVSFHINFKETGKNFFSSILKFSNFEFQNAPEFNFDGLLDPNAEGMRDKTIDHTSFNMKTLTSNDSIIDKNKSIEMLRSLHIYAEDATRGTKVSKAIDDTRICDINETYQLYLNNISTMKGTTTRDIFTRTEEHLNGEFIRQSDSGESVLRLEGMYVYENAVSTNKESDIYIDNVRRYSLFENEDYYPEFINKSARKIINASPVTDLFKKTFATINDQMIIDGKFDDTTKIVTITAKLDQQEYKAILKDNLIISLEETHFDNVNNFLINTKYELFTETLTEYTEN